MKNKKYEKSVNDMLYFQERSAVKMDIKKNKYFIELNFIRLEFNFLKIEKFYSDINRKKKANFFHFKERLKAKEIELSNCDKSNFQLEIKCIANLS